MYEYDNKKDYFAIVLVITKKIAYKTPHCQPRIE